MKVTIAQKGAVRSKASSRLAPAHSMTLHAARIAVRSTGGAFMRPIQRYETSCERTGGTRVSEDEGDSISNRANLIGSVAGDTGNVGRNGRADGRICVLMSFRCRPLGAGGRWPVQARISSSCSLSRFPSRSLASPSARPATGTLPLSWFPARARLPPP